MATLTNWAGNHTYRATTVHRPTSLDALREVVVASPRLRVLGSRHCFNDIADSTALVSLDDLPVVREIDSERRVVRVGGGTRYGDLATRLHAEGWALHNLASLPHISVAGAVATATHGSGDRHRSLAGAVRGLQLLTSGGDVVELGGEDAELAGAVVSLGALGVVTEVELAIEPTYDVAQRVHTALPWEAALGHFDEVSASADSVSLFTTWASGAVDQVWRKARVGADGGGPPAPPQTDPYGALPAETELHPLAGVDPTSTTAQGGVPGPWHERWPHFRMEFTPSFGAELQSEYFVDRRHAADAMRAVLALADRIAPLLLISEVRTVAADDLWLSMASGRDSVALHFTWEPRQPEVETLLPTLEAVLAPFDARPHWGKLFSATGAGDPDRLEALYPRMAEFRALVARLDPRGTFRNEFLERHVLRGS